MVITPSSCLGDPEVEIGRKNVYPDSDLRFTKEEFWDRIFKYTSAFTRGQSMTSLLC
jgi:hypothetical protein